MSNAITTYNDNYTKFEILNNNQKNKIIAEKNKETSNLLTNNTNHPVTMQPDAFFDGPTTLASRQVTNRPQEARTTPCRYFHEFLGATKSKINVFSRHIAMLPQLASDIMYAVTGNDP